jgi:endonuclease G, mitochondrial
MDKLERATRLKAMLSQIAPGGEIESIPKPQLGAGLEGLGAVMPEPDVNVESGLRKMAENRGHEVTLPELDALEAIVMPANRPVVFVRGDSYDNVGAPWTALNKDDVKARIRPLLPMIGRIEVPHSLLLPYAGTGFVVGKNLLMTNRHVAALFTQGLGLRIRYQQGDAAVDFKRQVDSAEDDRSAYLLVQGVEMIHPYWDMALLRVDGLEVNGALKLSVRMPEDLVGRNIVAIGYPARDERSDLSLQDRIFEKTYNVKRLQPGTIRQYAKVRSFENLVNAMTHDSSTLGGNSGSAVIDVDSGEVVALHFSGEYLKGNYAVPMCMLARDRRVAPKLNFQGTLPPTNDWEPAWRQVEGAEDVPPPSAPPVQQDAGSVLLQSPHPSPAASWAALTIDSPSLAASWTIPLRITVAIGQPSEVADRGSTPGGFAAGIMLPNAAEEEGVVVDQNYAERPGYDPMFLEDVEVPLPRISQKMEEDTAVVNEAFRKGSDRFELAYYHYSVYMNKRRRTAWFSAANVDGGHRHDIGKRHGDRWFIDPRISRPEQLGQEAFEHGIDRGHLTRRQDTAWGPDVASALKANNDTFHFTNCSLHAALFNRAKHRWQGIEQFLLEKHAKKDKRRMVVITGPVFAGNDPVYRNDNMDYSVRCPIQFWKVCVLIRENGTPSATAFVLGQEDITGLPGFEAVFDVAAAQVKLVDLEEKTGLNFGDLKKYDHFAHEGDPGTLELPGVGQEIQQVKVIRTGADVVI